MALMTKPAITPQDAQKQREKELAAFQAQQAAVKTPQVNNIADPNANPQRFKQFETMRMRAQQEGSRVKADQGEALKRRFASLGNVNSGAYIKAAQLQDAEADRATAQAVQDVDMAQQQESARLQDVADERKFQSGESEKLRIFNKELADRDQAFRQIVFSDESRLRWADLDESMRANRVSTGIGLAQMAEDDPNILAYLRAAGGPGSAKETQRVKNLREILQRYGYG